MSITRVLAIAVLINGSSVLIEAQQPPRPVPTTVWAAKPIKTPPYKAGLKPWVKLADLKARHKGQASWHEVIVDDGRLTAEYVAAAPGTKVSRAFSSRHARMVCDRRRRGARRDRRTGAVHRDARIAREHSAADDLLARDDRHGAEPAIHVERLRREDRVSERRSIRRRPPPGTAWTEVRINRTPGRYDEFNQPHLNIHAAAAKDEKYAGGRFVRDDKSEMLVLYGHEKNMPPLDPADKGHFHAESAEMWLVFSGKIRYAFEGPAAVHRQRRRCRLRAGEHLARHALHRRQRRAACRSPNTSATPCFFLRSSVGAWHQRYRHRRPTATPQRVGWATTVTTRKSWSTDSR